MHQQGLLGGASWVNLLILAQLLRCTSAGSGLQAQMLTACCPPCMLCSTTAVVVLAHSRPDLVILALAAVGRLTCSPPAVAPCMLCSTCTQLPWFEDD